MRLARASRRIGLNDERVSENADFPGLTSRFQETICSGGIYLAPGREIHGAAVVVCYVQCGKTQIRLGFNRSLIGGCGKHLEKLPRGLLAAQRALRTRAAISSGQLGSSPTTKSRVGRPSGANAPPATRRARHTF